MKLFTKILLAFCIFLNCAVAIGANKSLHKATVLLSSHSQQNLYHSFFKTSTKFLPCINFRHGLRLLVTEYEDDTETNTGKKESSKVNPGDVFSTTYSFASRFNIVNNFFNGRLFTTCVLNKVYLTLQVFRL